MLTQFLVMEPHEDEGVTFLAHEVINLGVVISFILTAEDKDGRLVLLTPSDMVTPGCSVG